MTANLTKGRGGPVNACAPRGRVVTAGRAWTLPEGTFADVGRLGGPRVSIEAGEYKERVASPLGTTGPEADR